MESDVQKPTIEGKGFAAAVFALRLGATPPSTDLETGMLGGGS